MSRILLALFFFLFALPIVFITLSFELGVKDAVETMMEDI